MSEQAETPKFRPVRGGLTAAAIVAGVVGGSFIIDRGPVASQPSARATSPKPRVHEQPKPRVPDIKRNSVSQMARALMRMNLGLGNVYVYNTPGRGSLEGAVSFPNGSSVVTQIVAKNNLTSVESIKPDEVTGIYIELYKPGYGYLSTPLDAASAYWFSTKPNEDYESTNSNGTATITNHYHYDAGVGYFDSPTWLDAYQNGVVAMSKTGSNPNAAFVELVHAYGNKSSANLTVHKIEEQALGIEAYVSAGQDLPDLKPIEHPNHIDKHF